MDNVDVTIIGGGIVGLSIAAELSRDYDDIVLLERHDTFGQEISSRNSEVLHAGIYYPSGSLKARLCVQGIELIYSYCLKHAIRHSRLGKLIVAVDQSEINQLEDLYNDGIRNGVRGLELIERGDISKIQPNVTADCAILSHNTGIVDVHSLMNALYNEAVSAGVVVSFNSEVDFIARESEGYVIGIKDESYRLLSRIVINAAGLSADHIASLSGIDIDKEGYRLEYRKGSYFSYSKKSPISMLVYPLPIKKLAGLGVHATLDLGGRLRFGPDSELVESIDYTVDIEKRDDYYNGVSRFIRGLDKEAFTPDMAGIRPAIKGDAFHDFIIFHETDKGMEGFVNMVGIESPGLTASLAIARHIKSLLTGI